MYNAPAPFSFTMRLLSVSTMYNELTASTATPASSDSDGLLVAYTASSALVELIDDAVVACTARLGRVSAVCGLCDDVCAVCVCVVVVTGRQGTGRVETGYTKRVGCHGSRLVHVLACSHDGVLVDGCGCAMGVTTTAMGAGGSSGVLSSMGAMGTDESSRAVNKELVATALDEPASSLSSTTATGAGVSGR